MSATLVGLTEIQNGKGKPANEPARAVRYVLDFSQSATYQLDFSELQDKKRLSVIECVYVDNSAGSVPINLTAEGTQHVMECEPGQYGYFNLLFGIPAKLRVESPGNNALVSLFVLNVNLFGSWKKEQQPTPPSPQPVSGTVAVSNLPATQAISGSVSVSNFPTVQPISGSVAISNIPTTQPVTDATLESIVVSGAAKVAVQNFPATQPISGNVSVSNLPATQAVSGSVSIANFPATQAISGSVAVSNLPATQAISGSVALTNASLVTADTNVAAVTANGKLNVNFPATQPVSGSVSVANFPATQPVSGSVSIANFPASQTVADSNIATALSSFYTPTTYASNRMQVMEFPVYGAKGQQPRLQANQSYVANFTTSQSAIITGTPGYFITAIQIFVDARAFVSGGTFITFTFVDSQNGTVWLTGLGVPVTNGSTSGLPSVVQVATPANFFWNNKTANSNLSVTLSQAWPYGFVFLNINYGLCSFVGN